jgi:hypothetical protein
MHTDELEVDEALVHRLLANQFPSGRTAARRVAQRTVNAIFRLGDELGAAPRRNGPTKPG